MEQLTINFYPINEALALRAHESTFTSDYKMNSATNEYKSILAEFSEDINLLINAHPNNATSDNMELINQLADRYSKKLADAINELNRIDSSCVSWMLSGPANYPMKKHQKQQQARDNFYAKNQSLFDPFNNRFYKKIRNLLTNATISSSDALAVEKLKLRIEELEEKQDLMKRSNAWYRENGTMIGFENLTDEQAKILDEAIKNAPTCKTMPYAPFKLTNNNQNINRLKGRVKKLEAMKERTADSVNEYEQIEGLQVEEDKETMRIKLIFDSIPSKEERDILKLWGFKWSPSNSAWQRMLNHNGIYATKQVISKLKALNA
jgi:hypothetical protein